MEYFINLLKGDSKCLLKYDDQKHDSLKNVY